MKEKENKKWDLNKPKESETVQKHTEFLNNIPSAMCKSDLTSK